jgi:Ca2+-binding EF-hand superfamily protein
MQRQFKIIDDNNSRSLDQSEFVKACRDYRVNLPDKDVVRLFHAFDRDNGGSIDYDEFLRVLRGPMNEFRASLVQQAFRKLDRDSSGVIDINDLRDFYSGKNHPDVRAGKKTEDEVLEDFLETFELHHNMSDASSMDHRVTVEEFVEYYTNISASIDDDAYFETMMTNAWRL